MKITIVGGTRPNFVKIAPLVRALKARKIQYRLVHTGQHYDKKLSDVFFDELELTPPDVNLESGSGTQAEQTAEIMIRFERDLATHPADLVVVVGDVNSTMACAIVAKKMNVLVAHVEAGIRSFDMTMPEEVNRLVTDAISDYFFTTSHYANKNLKKAGIEDSRIFFVGNVMIDSLVWGLNKLSERRTKRLIEGDYLALTLHRPSNVDDPLKLASILNSMMSVGDSVKYIFPVHPRTARALANMDIDTNRIQTIEPLSYLDFIQLIKDSIGVITDSGGVQEEATFLGIPCLTLRNNTERPETVAVGTNELIAPDQLVTHIERICKGDWKKGAIPELWDGRSSIRIVEQLETIGAALNFDQDRIV